MNVLLVGCGKMGGALLVRWKDLALYSAIFVIEPTKENVPVGTLCGPDASSLPDDFHADIVVFAVKPQSLPDIIHEYKPYVEDGAVFLSIAAGKPISFFEEHLGTDAKVIRAMPNTPAAIGMGITVACSNGNVSPYEKENAEKLLVAVGEMLWVKNEDLLNPVTALSGSGPAYVFLLIEVLAEAGVKAGLDRVMAEKLARKTVIGSAVLAASSDLEAATLRKNVTSPGGTTEAALKVLMGKNGIQGIFDQALAAATTRARELSE